MTKSLKQYLRCGKIARDLICIEETRLMGKLDFDLAGPGPVGGDKPTGEGEALQPSTSLLTLHPPTPTPPPQHNPATAQCPPRTWKASSIPLFILGLPVL